MSTATKTVLAWDLKKGQHVQNPENHEERTVEFVGSRKNWEGKRAVFFRGDETPWWVGSRTEVDVVEVEE